jgi:ferredoxin-NADP reductase
MLGLINQALSNGHQVTLLHYSRTVSSKLQHQWQQLSDAYPDFIYHLIHTEDPTTYLAGERYLSAEGLLSLNLPLVDTKIFACGSQALLAGLYKTVNEISVLQNIQLRDNIIVENFGNALTDFDGDGNQLLDNALQTESHTVYLRSRQRQFDSDTTLLVAAENAGIRLAYGCRQGICQLCRCNKVSGMVKNIQTGKVSGDGYESIQTCINIAMTDLVLDV